MAGWGIGRRPNKANPNAAADTTTNRKPMSSADMMPPSLPVEPEVPDEPGTSDARRSAQPAQAEVVLGRRPVSLVAAVLGAAFVPTPYVLIQPGAVRSAEDRVVVEGTESFPNDSSVLFHDGLRGRRDALRSGAVACWTMRSKSVAPRRCTATGAVTRRDGSTAARWTCRSWSQSARHSGTWAMMPEFAAEGAGGGRRRGCACI
ncbi:MAG: hypothetical protein M5U19_08425 [Microthrixaceae bacterium]|nr:hypothetical protein [Microthrixaceae bacterium]